MHAISRHDQLLHAQETGLIEPLLLAEEMFVIADSPWPIGLVDAGIRVQLLASTTRPHAHYRHHWTVLQSVLSV